MTVHSLVQAGRELSAWRETEQDEDPEARIEAAAKNLPANADLRAIIEAAIWDPEQDLPEKAAAAMRAWLERDAMAAVHWISAFQREYQSELFDDKLKRYLKAGGTRRLQEFIDAEPRIRDYLIGCASSSFGQDGGNSILLLAASLKSPQDRLDLIKGSYRRGESLAGNLATVRSLLDEGAAMEFLRYLVDPDHAGLLGEVQRAGFPESAVRRFEEDCSKERWGKGGVNRNNIDVMLNNPNRLGQPATWDSLVRSATWNSHAPRTNADFLIIVDGPIGLENVNVSSASGSIDFPRDQLSPEPVEGSEIPQELLAEIGNQRLLLEQGRLSLVEMVAWLKKVGTADEEMDRRATVIALDTGMDSDPVAALSWLKECRTDWRDLMGTVGWQRLPPEVLIGLSPEVWEKGSSFDRDLQLRCLQWLKSDPQAYLETVDRLSTGFAKDRLFRLGKEREE
ncbi:hypothetical protein [Luteolibacter luteus]|uniref:Uncharacterized protein n=1 Tax=Luteolibacter luteus TaxID=2728835 RepID=A0A858RFE0_9BACT|nr:hypothetical protein [Luteolibacter luteus]QJE95435.1 hypothetical protein HHL09_06455 [Luteolibacter luteus]